LRKILLKSVNLIDYYKRSFELKLPALKGGGSALRQCFAAR